MSVRVHNCIERMLQPNLHHAYKSDLKTQDHYRDTIGIQAKPTTELKAQVAAKACRRDTQDTMKQLQTTTELVKINPTKRINRQFSTLLDSCSGKKKRQERCNTNCP